ncbi:hypothetical protein H4Q26_015004 [Puccinia striiformis f. sp. tritici PST-130]|nr:hypothetical protein H4Q26_015004 [Puccinia striiformis f. sp. tritici PST-130]
MAQIPKAFRAHNLSSTRLMLGCSIDIGNVARRLYSSSSSASISTARTAPNGNLLSQAYSLHDQESGWFEVPVGHSEGHKNVYNPADFVLYPRFLDDQEQDLILDHSLSRLDKMERPRARRRCHLARADEKQSTRGAKGFRDEKEYSFEAGHFDEVISGYREMQVAQLVPDLSITDSSSSTSDTTTSSYESLKLILARLQAILPQSTRPPLIHLLHLSSKGKIDPHVDNLEASGSTIIGLSLGSTRVMRLGHKSVPIDAHLKVLLPPGSVYIQRDSVRYNLQHSIPANDSFRDRQIIGAQRLSVMLRVKLKREPKKMDKISTWKTSTGTDLVTRRSADD